jgi:uncharacterized OsmC-like protein
MTSKVTYTGNLRTLCTHQRSGSTIETDAPVDNHGKGERFSPTDLLATALASCMITTMGIACLTHNIDIDGMECDVEKIMVPNPRKVGEVKIDMRFPVSKPFTEKEMKILETAALKCPIMESLHPDCKKTLNITWPA